MSDRAGPSAPVAPRVEAVVFDVGRVLIEWDLRHLFAKLIDDPQRLDHFLGAILTEEWHFQHDQGRSLDDMVPELQTRYPNHAALIAAYRARFLETIPGPVPGAWELVGELAARGVPLYAITNFGAEFWDRFRPTAPVLDHFRDIVVSGREKVAKPDPAIFHLAAERFGHAPERMLFIDDNAANILTAQRLGWQGHHFRDAPALERDLRARALI